MYSYLWMLIEPVHTADEVCNDVFCDRCAWFLILIITLSCFYCLICVFWSFEIYFTFLFLSHLLYCLTSWNHLWKVYGRINSTGLKLLACRTTTVKWRMKASCDFLPVYLWSIITSWQKWRKIFNFSVILSIKVNCMMWQSRSSTPVKSIVFSWTNESCPKWSTAWC